MKPRILATLGLSLVTSNFVACASQQEDAGDENLPGDIDNASNSGGTGGKADGFDTRYNNPALLSQSLEYRLENLPKEGRLEKAAWAARYPNAPANLAPAWSDTYWPSYNLSHNARWRGSNVKSPLELYDAAFNGAQGCETQPNENCGPSAKAKWDEYFTCAGPATKWQMQNYQYISNMFDGFDNDNNGTVDDCSSSDDEGPQGWWGTCHAWSPAALLEPEPQYPVEINGVTFTPGDIKALIQNAYDRTQAIMIGGRCNAKEINHDVNGSENEACRDTNAGVFHVVITNALGIGDVALVEDRTANFEVWNQPMVGYKITQQDEISVEKANECVGNTGSTWSYNRNAKKLVEVRLTTNYLTETHASVRPVGMDAHIAHDDYHYILELADSGKVIGGRWCSENVDDHPDFLWAPIKTNGASNPSVALANVRELIAKSLVAPGGNGTGEVVKVMESTPALEIPDNSPAGASVEFIVSEVTAASALDITVDVAHTYRGDLSVVLSKDGREVKTLFQNEGGSADNLAETFRVSKAEIGADLNGKYSVLFVDNAGQDIGTINKVKLSFIK